MADVNSLPTVARVRDRSRKTVAAQAARLAGGAASWSDTPGRTDVVPMVIDRASGSKVWDLDGNEYVDLTFGVWSAILGHAAAPVVEAVQREAARGLHVGLPHALETELSRILIETIPCAEMSFLANSGTEAVMHAAKLARAATGRKLVVKFDLHYHGHFDQLVPDLHEFKLGAADSGTTVVLQRRMAGLDKLREIGSDVACVIIEPAAPGRDVLFEFEPNFFRELRAVTHELGIALVFDEVFWGFRQRFGATLDTPVPDMAVFGKIIGGGLPIGAVVGQRRFLERGVSTGDPALDAATRVPILGTFSGNRIVCAAGVAQLRELQQRKDEIYPYMREQCDWLCREIDAHCVAKGYAARLVNRRGMFFPRFWATHEDLRQMTSKVNMQAQRLFGTYLRAFGVFLSGGAAQITIAHDRDDMQKLARGLTSALDALCDDGVISPS